MPQKNDNLTLLDNPTATLLEKFIVPRPSVGERMAAGKAIRDKVPREKHGEFRRPFNTSGPGLHHRGTSQDPASLPGPDPPLADARLPVRLSARRGSGDGSRPGSYPHDGDDRTSVR